MHNPPRHAQERDTVASADSNPHTDAYADAYAYAYADTDTDTDPYSHTHSNSNSNPHADTDTQAGATGVQPEVVQAVEEVNGAFVSRRAHWDTPVGISVPS